MDSKELKTLPKEINPPLSWDIREKCQKNFYEKRWKGAQRRIGITGGIASGKSVVGKYLKEARGLPILDADIYARNLLSPDSPTSTAVVNHFGKKIIQSNQSDKNVIDRSVLAKIIFSDQTERLWLESLMHPLIKNQLEKDLKKLSKFPTLIMIIPLLFEANLMELCSEVWVVHCSLENQLERLMKRNCLSKDESEKMIYSQLPLDIKREIADITINNNYNMQSLIKEIEMYF